MTNLLLIYQQDAHSAYACV